MPKYNLHDHTLKITIPKYNLLHPRLLISTFRQHINQDHGRLLHLHLLCFNIFLSNCCHRRLLISTFLLHLRFISLYCGFTKISTSQFLPEVLQSQRMTAFLSSKIRPPPILGFLDKITPQKEHKPQSRCHIVCEGTRSSRRHVLANGGAALVSVLAFNCGFGPLVAWAGDEPIEQDESLVGAIKSLFDPNEKTKSGKVLAKAYLNSAREVVKTLRESLNEDPNNMAKFRRTADAAKESIREYLGSWRGQPSVMNEESYVVIEKAIRSLARFYSKAGPSAPLPEEVKLEIISNLDTADKFL